VGHPAGHEIFAALNDLADSPDVVRTRLVNGRVTLIHRRVWPALVRVADRFPHRGLAGLREEHQREAPSWSGSSKSGARSPGVSIPTDSEHGPAVGHPVGGGGRGDPRDGWT
jgi:hypothetical protein